MSPMYGFIYNIWVLGRIDSVKLQMYVAKFITEEEMYMILATPQTGEIV